MRTKSLNFRLMVSFILVITIFSIFMFFLLFKSFKNYYYEDIFRTMEDKNEDEFEKRIEDIDEFIASNSQDKRSIEEIYWTKTKDGKLHRRKPIKDSNVAEDIISEVEENIKKQKESSKRYEVDIDGRKLFYVINKYDTGFKTKSTFTRIIRDKGMVLNYTRVTGKETKDIIDEIIKGKIVKEDIRKVINNQITSEGTIGVIKDRTSNIPTYLYKVSFKWEAKDDTLEKNLFIQIGFGFIIVIIILFLFSFYLSKHLTGPLMELTNNVNKISNRELDNPMKIMDRDDEIGSLANSIEKMRRELFEYDKEQRFKLHSISHELKTPIMIVKSYVEALKKGLYPKGSLDASLEIIDEECGRLEKLVYNLLYIQRLDYLDSEIANKENINIKELIEEVIDNFSFKLEEIETRLDIDDIYIHANHDHIKIIIENIVENQIRYAKTLIKISLKEDFEKIYLTFYNDGESIINIGDIFKLFKKGKRGQSGLGLYIVNRLLKINNGEIYAKNEEQGVSFYIEIEKRAIS
ncbi:HAMP domain-containing sensor histidine kinase [Wukongibacter baidiensis]|uniref:HAMP domain-containing sensor histidine kinase n=1 Tax=Wukongibacter baidiensis TaxID=1723361 RepID=UPI003D7F6CAF